MSLFKQLIIFNFECKTIILNREIERDFGRKKY